MTEEIMQTIASHDWPGWASHVVRAKYDPETQKLKTRYADAMDYCVRSVPDGTALPTGFRPAGDGVILIPVNLEGEVAAREREATGLFELDAVTRVEVITGRRDYVRRFTEPGATLAVQDDGRTLKVFIEAGGDDDVQ